MGLVSLAVSVMAFLQSRKAERRSKQAFDEGHEIRWAVSWEPVAGPVSDMEAVRLLFRNAGPGPIADKAWVNLTQLGYTSICEVTEGVDVRVGDDFSFMLTSLNDVVLHLPDALTVQWIPRMTRLDRVAFRLRGLLESDDVARNVHEQVVSLADAKKQIVAQRTETLAHERAARTRSA